jgi:Ca2+-binding EF-hand superfamily protein
VRQEANTPRFNKQTLQRWFRDIDKNGSGVISQRELIVALREKKELLAMLSRVNSLGDRRDESSPSPRHGSRAVDSRNSHRPASRVSFQSNVPGEAAGNAESPVPESAPVRGGEGSILVSSKGGIEQRNIQANHHREEIYRIKEILREVDTDNSGTMEWNEFVDFFRRAGFLLEYAVDHSRNRTTLCLEHEAEQLRCLSRREGKRHDGEGEDLDVPLLQEVVQSRSSPCSPDVDQADV